MQTLAVVGLRAGWLPLAGGACVGADQRVHQLCLQKAKGMLWPLGHPDGAVEQTGRITSTDALGAS